MVRHRRVSLGEAAQSLAVAPGLPLGGPGTQWGQVVAPPPVATPVSNGAPPLTPGSEGGPPAPIGEDAEPTLSLYLPEVFPIPGAQEFQITGQANVTGPAGTITVLPAQAGSVAALVLPPHYQGIIRTVDIFAGGAAGLTFTTNQIYQILVNGAVAPGWGSRTFFGRTASSVEQAFDAFIRIPDGGSVTLQNINEDGGTYTVGMWIAGWYWPVVSGQQWMAGQGSFGGV